MFQKYLIKKLTMSWGNIQFYLMLIALIIANLIDSLFFKIIGLYTVIFLFMKGNARFQSKNKKEKKNYFYFFFTIPLYFNTFFMTMN